MLDTILKQIDLIAAAKGKAKEVAMHEYSSELLRKVFLYALDPYRMYYIKSFNLDVKPLVNSFESDQEMFCTLNALTDHSFRFEGGSRQSECEFVCQKYLVPAELLHRIINKDLRCGVAATTVNKVWPGLIPDFKVALAKEYEESDEDQFPKLASIKYDGLRCIALCDESGIKFYTRNGLEITSAEHVKSKLHEFLPPFEYLGVPVMLDGELMKTEGHFQDSSGSIRSKSKQDPSLVYRIFDWMPLKEFQDRECNSSQLERWKKLQDWGQFIDHCMHHKHGEDWQLPFEIVGHVMIHNNAEVQSAYKAARDSGNEGLILKDPKDVYQFNRSKAWVKLKDLKTVDCKVIGLEPGKGKYTGKVGALTVDFEGKSNSVGSGLSDAQRELWHANPDIILGHMVEIAYHEKTKDGNMRHSRLIKERPDLD